MSPTWIAVLAIANYLYLGVVWAYAHPGPNMRFAEWLDVSREAHDRRRAAAGRWHRRLPVGWVLLTLMVWVLAIVVPWLPDQIVAVVRLVRQSRR